MCKFGLFILGGSWKFSFEAHEGQGVIAADIPDEFLQGNQDEVIHMVLHGKLAKLLIDCEPALYAPSS